MMGLFKKTVTAGSIVLCAFLLLRRIEKDDVVLSSIEESGFKGELHHTITEDGYILGLHRILRRANNTSKPKGRYPVLLVHGLESSAVDWINHHGTDSLPYLLLNEGYDVWLGNVRGTQASLNHTSIDHRVDPSRFWDSSVHEIGFYDLPAMVDYIINTTNSQKLFYVGISQGEATFLIMASTRPEYNSKIQLASLTSPSSHLKHSDNVVLKTLGAYWPVLQLGAETVGLYTVPGRDMVGSFCQYNILWPICDVIIIPFLGYSNPDQSLNANKLFTVYPVRSAFKQLLHYLQMYKSGIFRRFDYGKEGNLRIYGEEEPPRYDMQKIISPVAYFWGENDCWSRPKDMEDIERKLPNMVLSYRVPHKAFNHYDVLVAKDVKELVYYKIIETINRFNKT
ncbi:lipase 1-like [Coccinella septempunctata]|uniref:lipase 1-like n=1 Tax=Coccinella septempunctata TaxID=41139 RepID=UPI001D0751AA|nr:lipase 1-like [Coccinella septempunctata]